MLRSIIVVAAAVMSVSASAQTVPPVNSALPSCSDGAAVAYNTGNVLACKPSTRTVATLPVCAAGLLGASFIVTDALAPVALATVAGGGAVVVRVTCDGAVWKVM